MNNKRLQLWFSDTPSFTSSTTFTPCPDYIFYYPPYRTIIFWSAGSNTRSWYARNAGRKRSGCGQKPIRVGCRICAPRLWIYNQATRLPQRQHVVFLFLIFQHFHSRLRLDHFVAATISFYPRNFHFASSLFANT